MTQVSTLRIASAGPSSPSDEPAASILRSALLDHFPSTTTATGGTITVDNKYFTATVALTDLDIDSASAESSTDSAVDRKEDGMILAFHDVFSASSTAAATSPLDVLASVHSAAEASNQAGDLLRLLVAVTMGPVSDKSTKAAEEEYSRRVLWCLDRGYEYVEADCSVEGMKLGHEDREKDGFARVVEAVGGTVWSCAVNKPRGGAASFAAGTGPSADRSAAGATVPQPTERKESKAKSSSNSPFSLPPEAEIIGDDDDDGNDDEGGKLVFDDLEKVMAEAARIRSQAKSGALTDEQRRMRAGDAAVALMGVMERMGFDDSSSADGEDSTQGAVQQVPCVQGEVEDENSA